MLPSQARAHHRWWHGPWQAFDALTRLPSVAVASLLFPHGGQLVARRNAQEAVTDDQHRARARHEATAAVEATARASTGARGRVERVTDKVITPQTGHGTP